MDVVTVWSCEEREIFAAENISFLRAWRFGFQEQEKMIFFCYGVCAPALIWKITSQVSLENQRWSWEQHCPGRCRFSPGAWLETDSRHAGGAPPPAHLARADHPGAPDDCSIRGMSLIPVPDWSQWLYWYWQVIPLERSFNVYGTHNPAAEINQPQSHYLTEFTKHLTRALQTSGHVTAQTYRYYPWECLVRDVCEK